MSMFTLAISCLTTSSLPWFRDLKFQVLIQYCSLQFGTLVHHQTHPQLGVIFAWLSLFIPSWAVSLLFSSSILGSCWPGEFIFQYHVFCLFLLSMGFSKQECWRGLPFPPPVEHILLELSTMSHLPWVALHGIAHSFFELLKAVNHVICFFVFVFFCYYGLHSVWPRMHKDKKLVEASWWEVLLAVGQPESYSDGRGHAQ